MKFGVITFPGSNCDMDMVYVLEEIFNQKVEQLWHKDHDLKGCDFIIVPGGFSYGDYLRSGAIARFSPIMDEVIKHANSGGLVWGICNGFQILCEAGLIPGVLLHNNTQKYICKNVHIKAAFNSNLLTAECDTDRALKIPIAHGEGRYYIGEEARKELWDNEQVLFQYCDEEGNTNELSNPNGSVDNIAGVTNKTKNVFGMMPHPERAADPELKNIDGQTIFNSILAKARV